MTKIEWVLDRLALVGIGAAIVTLFSTGYVLASTPEMSQSQHIQDIYSQVIVATGQTQDALPLEISDNPTVNAYNDGTRIVIFQGLINYTKSDDEIALVLGHEIAHGTLHHLKELNTNDVNKVAELEANADKMGAVYMMKAGYNVCKGREFFHRLLQSYGNALGQNHPDFSYRYDELNVQCE